MKLLIFFALAFATALPKDFYSRSIENPVLENEGRITNGIMATSGQFKYQVGISLEERSADTWCGGSLIGENWVLSAAHCTAEFISAEIYLGATQRFHAEKCYEIEPKDVINHPLYNPTSLKNDISLIKIPSTNASGNIGFVRLPSNDHNKFLGDSAVVSGWGFTDDKSTILSEHLLYGILKVSPVNVCFDHYGILIFDDLQICVAVYNKVSPCKGDSGDPLVLEGENLQIGVYSFFYETGCELGFPSILTRVSAYRLWILVRTGIHY